MLECLPGDVLRLICRREWLKLSEIASLRRVCKYCARNLPWASLITPDIDLKIMRSKEGYLMFLLGNRVIVHFTYQTLDMWEFRSETLFGTWSADDAIFYPDDRFEWSLVKYKVALSGSNQVMFNRHVDRENVKSLPSISFSMTRDNYGSVHLFAPHMCLDVVFAISNHVSFRGVFSHDAIVPASFPFSPSKWFNWALMLHYQTRFKNLNTVPDLKRAKSLKVRHSNNSVYYHPLSNQRCFDNSFWDVGLIDVDENGNVVRA